MMNVTPQPIDGRGACKTCGCPLTLLRLERRRWENRTLCTRCGEPGEALRMKAKNKARVAHGAGSRASVSGEVGTVSVVDVLPAASTSTATPHSSEAPTKIKSLDDWFRAAVNSGGRS